jgi:protein SDA1
LNDPQELAEHLLSRLRLATQKNTFNFELRLEMMNLISRLIGVHKLLVLNFYDFLLSYIKPHQKNVTQILACLAQASHDMVPPDSMEAVIRAVADNFVWSNCASEVVTAGLNALREICVRSPLAMPEELLKSLIDDYKNHRDKGPMQAARALLGLFREFNPEMLKKKDRGKAASMNLKNIQVLGYGQVEAPTDVPDAEVCLVFNFLTLIFQLLELDSEGEAIGDENGIDSEEDAPELVAAEELEFDSEDEQNVEGEESEGSQDEFEEEFSEEDVDDEEVGSDEEELLGEEDQDEKQDINVNEKKQKLSLSSQKVRALILSHEVYFRYLLMKILQRFANVESKGMLKCFLV